MIKIGLMGCGTVADYGHLPAIVKTPGLQLVSLFDPDRGRLDKALGKFNTSGHTRGYTDAEAFFQSGIDAVAVTSPAPVHHENVLMAARYGKHVLCEKPIAMSDEQGEEMVAAMERAKLKFFVGFTYRFSPAAQEIRRVVRDGIIGDVRSLRLVYIWDCHGKYATRAAGDTNLNQRRVGRMLEGGPLVDCGVHQIDLARWWTGSEVSRFTGFGAWVDEAGYDAPDHVWCHMDHADGTHSMIESSFSYGHTTDRCTPHYVFEAIGSKGVVRYCADTKSFELRTATGVTPLNWYGEKNFEAMYGQFVSALTTGDSGPLASGRDGIVATHIAEQATRQAMAARSKQAPAGTARAAKAAPVAAV